jgi:hypothetical protein
MRKLSNALRPLSFFLGSVEISSDNEFHQYQYYLNKADEIMSERKRQCQQFI